MNRTKTVITALLNMTPESVIPAEKYCNPDNSAMQDATRASCTPDYDAKASDE